MADTLTSSMASMNLVDDRGIPLRLFSADFDALSLENDGAASNTAVRGRIYGALIS